HWASQSGTNPDRAAVGLTPEYLAYVIYTSGSTGAPKGVISEHRGLCNQIIDLQKRCDLCADDRLLQFASINFDVSAEEIFCALGTGAALILRTAAWVTGTSDFWTLCHTHQISWVDLTTRFWEQLVDDDSAVVPACLRRMIVGGEAVNGKTILTWFGRNGYRPRLFNAYGPTETTGNATIHEPGPGDLSPKSIGRPMANMRVYLLDRQGQPVPVGVSGELYIGGAGLARGYLNQIGLTAEKFVPDPFSREAGARLYRTGDLVRWRADGQLEFLGRMDHQVKLRGYRIELGEIEAALGEQAGVHQCVVAMREDHRGDKRLVAYVVREEGWTWTVSELREQLQKKLPEYMVPGAFVELDHLPVTSNGKLNRKALPEPEGNISQGYEAPVGEIETILARLWAELLHVEKVGRHD